jgi:hypothetical protein
MQSTRKLQRGLTRAGKNIVVLLRILEKVSINGFVFKHIAIEKTPAKSKNSRSFFWNVKLAYSCHYL